MRTELLIIGATAVLGANHVDPPATSKNMNGFYSVASGAQQDTAFNSDYASKGHEYFDVWAPEIATHYGEVFWTSQGAQPIPPQIVERFKGKVMAITGYEQDQVMVTPVGQPGVNPEKDVGVPINWAYNHHYMAWMTGKYSYMQEVVAQPGDTMAHGAPTKWVALPTQDASFRADGKIPVSQMFSEGNGGESRHSFHGYPDGYAQLIEDPQTWTITPMQIDTRNRECGVTPADINKCKQFTPGIEPKSARYGLGIPKEGTNYSGILECPCNSRYGGDPMFYPDAKTKILDHKYSTLSAATCQNTQGVTTATECFEAAATMGLAATTFHNMSISDPKKPRDCSVEIQSDGSANVYFNPAGQEKCGGDNLKLDGVAKSSVGVTAHISLDPSQEGGLATITLTGPADAWFGVGFNAQVMSAQPYTLIVNDKGVIEQKIGTCGSEADHCPGTQLSSSVKLVSNTVTDGSRTVVVTRPFKGATKDHYTFDPTANGSIDFITAVGKDQTFAYHKAHAEMTLSLTAVGAVSCICDIATTGRLCETGGKNCHSFVKSCVPAPNGDLLAQKNPTCNSAQYVGGLSCCGHKRIMLDADQDPGDVLLRYHMKFRFWFQEYVPNDPKTGKPSHYDLPRVYQQTEANAGEYDIPPAFARPGHPVAGYPSWPLNTPTPGTKCTGTCPDGPDCECIHEIHYQWNVGPLRLLYAGGHCHAPACISIQLFWKKPDGSMQTLCEQIPKYGNGTGSSQPLRFDEAGYLALPPCLWGKDKGLENSVFLPAGSTLYSIKKNRNTKTGHYGEMASWQMRGVNFPEPTDEAMPLPGFYSKAKNTPKHSLLKELKEDEDHEKTDQAVTSSAYLMKPVLGLIGYFACLL